MRAVNVHEKKKKSIKRTVKFIVKKNERIINDLIRLTQITQALFVVLSGCHIAPSANHA